MVDFLSSSLITPALTAAVSVGSIFLTNWLAQSRTSGEKLWELRRQTYGVILSNLLTVEHVCEAADSFIEEDAWRYFHDEAYDRHSSRMHEHMAKVRERFSDDFLILSDSFVEAFEAFQKDLEPSSPDEGPEESYERLRGAVRKHRPLLLALARKETAPRRPRLWKLWS